MIKIGLIGDPHLDAQTPASRLDNYGHTTILKLDNLLKVCLLNQIKVVILLGDVFHRYKQPIQYLNEVIEVFRKFREHGIEVYSIVGNHDIPYESTDHLGRTSIKLLFNSGELRHLRKLTLFVVIYLTERLLVVGI